MNLKLPSLPIIFFWTATLTAICPRCNVCMSAETGNGSLGATVVFSGCCRIATSSVSAYSCLLILLTMVKLQL